MMAELRVLVVEDESSTRQEMAALVGDMPEVAEVLTADNGAEAVRLLGTTTIDAAFLDILMPGLDGMDVARVLSVLSDPPSIVFVTASEAHAVEAFGIGAVDYLLKPIRPERLAESVGGSRNCAVPRAPPHLPRTFTWCRSTRVGARSSSSVTTCSSWRPMATTCVCTPATTVI